MRHRLGGAAVVAVAAMLLGGGCSDGPDNPGSARLRLVHASHDAPAVGVTLDRSSLLSSLALGASSPYTTITPGLRTIQLTDTTDDDNKTLLTAQVNASTSDITVFALNSADKLGVVISADARTPVADKAKIRLVHASPDAPAVDVRLATFDGDALFEDVAFEQVTPYSTVDAQAYTLVLVKTPEEGKQATAADIIATFEPVTLEQGKVYTAVAYGTADSADAHPLTVRVFDDTGDGTTSSELVIKGAPPPMNKARLMVVHASPDAPDLHVLAGGTKVNTTAVGYATSSGYLELDAGTVKITLQPAAGGAAALDKELTLDAGKAYTLALVGKVASLKDVLLTDDLTAPASGKTHLRLLHAGIGAPTPLDLGINGVATSLAENVAFETVSAFAPTSAETATVEARDGATVVASKADEALGDGKIVTVLLHGAQGSAKPISLTLIPNN